MGELPFFFCSNTPLHGQIVFSLDFSHHMTMWQLTSLENAKMHPKAKASSFPLNHIAQILFWTTKGKKNMICKLPLIATFQSRQFMGKTKLALVLQFIKVHFKTSNNHFYSFWCSQSPFFKARIWPKHQD